MPKSPREKLLIQYRHDSMDRTAESTQATQGGIKHFYRKDRLSSEVQDAATRSIFQYDEHVLAQQQHTGEKVHSSLLATDLQRSVLNALDATQLTRLAYTVYGHHPSTNGLASLLGFNGEAPDPVTGHYHLGKGYRQFNPVLMRFNNPDSLSPFGKGGFNAYMYCGGDPMNWSDPNGHIRLSTILNARTVGAAVGVTGLTVAGIGYFTNNEAMAIGGLAAAGLGVAVAGGSAAQRFSKHRAQRIAAKTPVPARLSDEEAMGTLLDFVDPGRQKRNLARPPESASAATSQDSLSQVSTPSMARTPSVGASDPQPAQTDEAMMPGTTTQLVHHLKYGEKKSYWEFAGNRIRGKK